MSNNLSIKNENFTKISLDKATVGKTYIIDTCNFAGDVSTRLAEMGLVPRTAVTILKKAPLGDPLEISLRGYSLCIRAEEARNFTVWEATR